MKQLSKEVLKNASDNEWKIKKDAQRYRALFKDMRKYRETICTKAANSQQQGKICMARQMNPLGGPPVAGRK